MEKALGAKSLFIGELIRRVHQELQESQLDRQAKREKPLFQIDTLTLEVNFLVTRSSEGKAGFDLQVIAVGGVEVGGAKAYEQSQVHKITLTLKAVQDLPQEESSPAQGGGGGRGRGPGFYPAPPA